MLPLRLLILLAALTVAGCLSTVKYPPVQLAPNQHPTPNAK